MFGFDRVTRFRVLSIFIWLMAILQHSLGYYFIILCILAFLAMAYSWSTFASIITLISVIGVHVTSDIQMYGFLLLFTCITIIAIFTIPYGSGPGYSGDTDSAGDSSS